MLVCRHAHTARARRAPFNSRAYSRFCVKPPSIQAASMHCCCVLCGAQCVGLGGIRRVQADFAHRIVRARCFPTAFHYEAVLAIPKDQPCTICPPCLNWRRGSRRGVRARRKRSYTPLDRSARKFGVMCVYLKSKLHALRLVNLVSLSLSHGVSFDLGQR